MLYVFRRTASNGAREVVEALQEAGVNARRLNDLARAHFGQGVRNGDHVICWGEAATVPAGVLTLNNVPVIGKFEEAQRLAAAGVPTITVSRTRQNTAPLPPVPVDRFPAEAARIQEVVREFVDANWVRGPVFRDAAGLALREINTLLQLNGQAVPVTPPAPVVQWVGRRNNHTGGADLLRPPTTPDFYVQRLNITEEYRVHSFLGRSIRAGVKRHRPDFRGTRSEWIRSFDAGWFIDYANFESTEQMREMARNACNALGLQFGAVDIGRTATGLIVLEVNRAPGVEGGTSTAYATNIQRWMNGELNAATGASGRTRRTRAA